MALSRGPREASGDGGGVCPWDSTGKNTGMGCHFLPQGIFPTQGSNLFQSFTTLLSASLTKWYFFFFFFYQGKMFIVTITQSQWFTLCFIPGCGHSLYNRYNSLQFLTEYFHCPPKSFVLSYPATDNHQSFYCLHSFAFSRMSYSWDHTVSNISRLPDFTCCCYCC